MEFPNNEVVRESEIFAALSPRHEGSSADRGASPGVVPAGSLPPVNPREANPILRLPAQVASPRSFQASTLSTKTPQSLMMSVPMTTHECSLVWKFLCDWVKTQIAMEMPASIPGFGTFYLRVQPLGIRITLFEPDQQFLSKFYIQVDSEVPDPALAAVLPPTSRSDLAGSTGRNRAASLIRLGEVFAFSFMEMASCCGSSVDAARAQDWLTVVIHKLGNAMSQCSRVELNIGVGVIVCADRVIQRHLLPRDSRSSPRLEYEIRTGESVVKRNLRAQAALKSVQTPKAKYSFLSGSNFSPSIQLNPVLDRSKEIPDFSFGPPPRPPATSFGSNALENKSSPRSTQLQKRYQRSASPLTSRSSMSVPPSQALPEERDIRDDTITVREQTEESRVPQLFDRLSRTLCVEPDQNLSCLLPSNRIGSNFTETAAFLMTEKSASQFGYPGQLTGGLVFVEKPVIRPLQSKRRKELVSDSTSEQRYFEYLSDDKLIDRCYLAPLPTDLETRVVSSAVKYIVGPSSEHIEKVMEVAHQEFVDNYYASAKKAILNYLLMRATSCERLGIPQGVPVHALLPLKWKWGSSDGPNGCIVDLKALVVKRGRIASTGISKRLKNTTATQSRSDGSSRLDGTRGKFVRRKRVHAKLMSLLVLSNPQVRALRYMWHDVHNSVSLVDLPGLSDAIEPMDIIEFERAQLAYSAKMKSFVMENWYTKTKVMFESAIRAETFSIHTSEAAVNFRLRHLFDTVAAVMSLQIRSLIMKSIQAYVKFFELFGGMHEESQDSDSNLRVRERPAYSGLLTTLTLQDGQIQFRDPLVDIPSRLLNVLHNIPKLFYNLGRIETQFDEPLALPNSSSPFLWNVASQEDDIVVATIRIRAIIEQNLMHLRKLQSDYDGFALTHRYVSSVNCFDLEENGELESYRAEMERVQATAMQLAIDNRHSQQLGLFSVDCRHVNTKLHSELAQWTIRLLQAFEQRTGRMNSELRQQYKEIAARLAKKPLDLYELVDSEAFVYSLKTSKLQELQEKGNAIKQRLRFLLFERESMHVGSIAIDSPLDAPTSELNADNDASSTSVTGFRLSADLLSSTAKTVKWRSHIEMLLKEAETLLVNERARIEAMFIAKRSRFQAEVDEFEGEVRGFAKKGDLRHAATYVVQLAKMKDNMYIFRQAMETIVKEEQKLQWKPTDFSKLDDIAEEMAPYEQLWKTVREFREMNSRWLRGNIFDLPGKEGLLTLQQMLTVVANVSSVLLLNSAAAAITAETVRKQMTDFRENVRLIVAIQNPAMKERHMKAVSALIGLDFIADESITLLKLLENGAFEMVNEIVDISSNATQEQQIERALNEMGDEWEATSFELISSKHHFSSSAVLAPFITTEDLESEAWNVVLDKICAERIVSLMEDHLLRLQTLSCMAHAGPFIEDIALWQAFASDTGQIVEMLKLIEQLWRKLTPLFAAGIVEAESKESQFFAEAARLYRSIHATILNQPICKAYFPRAMALRDFDIAPPSPSTALISGLNRCRELLEIVKGGVRVGFENKRSSFSRFYFLSEAELVTALALAGVPGDATLWKALSRCFPGISGVQTNAAKEITALLSSAGEPFPLGSPIVTADVPMPVWLAKVESSMSTILHASIRAACSDLPRKEFRKWCLIWPEQSLLAAVHYVWTIESEQAYQDFNQRKAWTDLTNSLYQNLDAVGREIKVAAYPHAKAALGNVILLLTQLRDVSSEVLREVGGMWVEESCDSSREMRRKSQQVALPRHPPSLTWIAQPRFYFIDSVLSVTVLSSSYLPYGLEYLGNGSNGILVTPLTLRCYHAIAQAASTMIKGVCLEGAAGAGKSTICHQFSRLCGRLYVTFQCANRKLLFDDLANFIKATAASGAWLCMDNMQILDPTTISMVTMLCSQVMTSLAARHAQCTLIGDKVRLRRGAMFLLTLTTGHRSIMSSQSRDLIPGARFFFRTIIVQSPDLEILAEFELQSGRFVHTSELAKLVTVALTAYARGFGLINEPTAMTDEVEVLGNKLVTLRQIKIVVKRATELNNLEKEHRRRTRKSILITPDDESDEAPTTGEVVANDATAEAMAKRDDERMEYRNVSQALREVLGSLVPSANLHLIDAVIRDFSAHALGRDLHMNKSIMWMSRGSSMLPSSRLGTLPARKSLEDDVESYVRTNESSWKRFGVEFGLKTVQLLQTMRTHRAVVLSGDIQAGKTSLYTSLSRALTQIAKRKVDERSGITRGLGFGVPDNEAGLVSPVRTIVVCPRALRVGQLLDPAAEHPSHSVFYKLLNEAKASNKADKRTQTWFVFDGDLDALWSEQLLYTVEEMQDDTPGNKQGLLLSTGKLMLIPEYVRVIMETTTLTNASPSFISRVGAVHVNTDRRSMAGEGWENVYGIWKTAHRTEFERYAAVIFVALDALMAETVSATLAFVSTNFESSYSGMERVQWMLALFHSGLVQSWKKFGSLTSDKQRDTAIHCLFLQALVWGVGGTTITVERHKFHLFLYDLILRGPNSEQSTLKRLFTLFFPSGTLIGSLSNITGGDKTKSAVSGGKSSPRSQTIYDYGFSVDFGSKWLPWTEYYTRWVKMLLGSVSSELTAADISLGSVLVPDYPLDSCLNGLLVPTVATSAAVCLSGQLLLTNYPTILCGSRDCGKSVCGSTWMQLCAALSRVQVLVAPPPSTLPSTDTEVQGNEELAPEESASIEKVYTGFYTKASDVLLRFESVLQRIRVDRQESSKRESRRSRAVDNDNDSDATPVTTTPPSGSSKHTLHVYVDDLHCFDSQRRMDSALELLRMMTEYHTMVDPSTNLLTPCQHFLPFLTRQVPSPRMQRGPTETQDLERLVRRFIPITLLPFSDSDLCSICESYPASVSTPSAPRELPPGPQESVATSTATNGGSSAAAKGADQLQSIIIKASLKLFRLLTSSNDFTILQKDTAFNPIKLHYNFRVAQLFFIVKSICCIIRPTLTLAEKPALARLWCHESARVLGDGIMESKEVALFHRRTLEIALTTFGITDDAFFPTRSETAGLQTQTSQDWFANDLLFSFIGDASASGTYHNGYHEVNEISKVEAVVERSMMAMYREETSMSDKTGTSEALEVVLCSFVVKHVLRMSRLLRMDRKAVLLLGARGRKLVTITRLACFICKQSSIVYHISAQEAPQKSFCKDSHADITHTSNWIAAFRAAMFKSIRSRDVPVVFIVKDAYLDPDSYPFRVLDQFLGDHSVTSDVVTYEDLDDEILSTLRENLERERKSTPPSRDDSHHSASTHHQIPSVLGSKSTIMSSFFQHVRQNLKLVLIFSPPPRFLSENETPSLSWGSILWRFPNILKCCEVNYVGAWSDDGLIEVAQKCFSRSSLATDKQSSTQFAEAAAQVYHTTTCFMGSSGVSEENENSTAAIPRYLSFMQADASMLVDHVSLFASHYDRLEHAVSVNLARYKAGLEFIDQTARILKSEQAQAELLLPEVQHKTELRRRMSGTLEREKITTGKLTKALELATTLVVSQRERLATVTKEYQDLMKDSNDIFDEMKDNLRVFHEAFASEDDEAEERGDSNSDQDESNESKLEEGDQTAVLEEAADIVNLVAKREVNAGMTARHRLRKLVHKFTAMEHIPSSIYQLSECLGVLLGIDPVEGRDEMDPDEVIMNYWENVAIEMKKAAFWKKLMTFDVPSKVSEKMVSALLPICRSPDFDKELFASVHEVAGVLCEWVQKCTNFARDFILAEPKHAQLQREQELLKQAEAQVVRSKMDICDQTNSSRHTNEMRDLSEVERQRADEKLQDTTSLLHLTNIAWKVLSSTRAKWQRMHDSYSVFATHWQGDLLLATATVAYASVLTRALRVQLYQLWQEAISALVVPSPSRRSLHEVFLIREADLTKMCLNGLPANDDSALENAVIALHSYRLPLLIDPYGVATDWLKKHLNSQTLTVVSTSNIATDAAVWKAVETSIKHESALILTDVSKECLQSLHSFIGAKRRALFDAVNHDISAGNHNSGGYHCWCHPPASLASGRVQSGPARAKVNLPLVDSSIFEFGSDDCKVFLIYTDTNDPPSWLSEYLNQLTVIQFEMTAPFVESQALQKLLESQGRLRELTEIRTLQQDMVICDEQISGLEEELLEFFSTEQTDQVYADNSKSLRIVANRSAVHTLKNTKAEANTKVQAHWRSLANYIAVSKRCLDAVWAWREFDAVQNNGNSERMFTLSWIWQLLVRAGEVSNKSNNNLEVVMACFTSYLQQSIVMNLPDEDRLLFRFLLAFRIWQRRMEEVNEPVHPVGGESIGPTCELSHHSRRTTDTEMLGRLLALINSKMERNSHDTCRPTLKGLLSLRPTGMKSTAWSAICYLAEASGDLRQFISRMEHLGDGQIAWKALLELGTGSSNDWQVPAPLNEFTRLCIVTAVHPHRFMCEIEDFAGRELQRMHTAPVNFTHSISLIPEMNTPSLPTVVVAAAHTATAQAPDKHRDLFFMSQSFSSSKAPLVVFCPPSIDFVDAVADVARRAGATMDTTDSIQLLLADQVTFKTMLLQAMEKGQWVVLPNLEIRHDRFAQLSCIYDSLEDGRAHSDFRLWISITNQHVGDHATQQTSFDSMRISRIATKREWGTGSLSLKRSLHHSFAILKHELESFEFASTTAAYPTVTSPGCSAISEHEEQCMKQLGVFHALVTSRDHFPFVEWKLEGEFGDPELCTTIRSLVMLRTEERALVKELPSPLSKPGIGMWTTMTLRGVISSVYASSVKAPQDRLLIQSCIDLVLNAWSTAQDEGHLHPTAIVAQITTPEVVFAIEKLAVMPWVSIVSAIPHLWISESCGPSLPRDVLAEGVPHSEGMLWDPYYLRRDRQKQIVAQLAAMVANRGCQIRTRLMNRQLPANMEVTQVLDLLAAFRKNLEGVVMLLRGGVFEYRKPITALMYHEQQTLEKIRTLILRDIRRLELVAYRGGSLDSATWQLTNELRGGRTPACWLALLRLGGASGTLGWSLEKFQQLVLDRLNTFASWQEPKGDSYKLQLSMFADVECAFEAIHQHFIRNHVGSALCSSDCLKVVSMFEDSPRLTLPAKEDVIYLTGVRVMGHLQLQIIDSKGRHRRTPISPEGVAAVLQVTSSCLAEVLGMSSHPSEPLVESGKSKAADPGSPNTVIDYPCPLIHILEGCESYNGAKTSIRVMSSLPLEQLVFSGASLQLSSIETNEK